MHPSIHPTTLPPPHSTTPTYLRERQRQHRPGIGGHIGQRGNVPRVPRDARGDGQHGPHPHQLPDLALWGVGILVLGCCGARFFFWGLIYLFIYLSIYLSNRPWIYTWICIYTHHIQHNATSKHSESSAPRWRGRRRPRGRAPTSPGGTARRSTWPGRGRLFVFVCVVFGGGVVLLSCM